MEFTTNKGAVMTTRFSFTLALLLSLGAYLTLSGCVSQGVLTATANEQYSLEVNYDRTIEDSLKAGKYGWSYYEIVTRNFPSNESGTKTIMVDLVELRANMVMENVIKEQASKGLRPATLKELLAFGEIYPDIQTKLTLLGLGSYCDLIVVRMGVFNWNTMETETTRSLERLYPYLSREMLGRTANLMETGSMSEHHSPGLYGVFVEME
jgi:hypothetical protein